MIPDGHDWLDVATLIVALLVAIGGFGGVVGWLMQRGKLTSEARKTNAETSELYQKIADQAATKALKLEERITAMECLLDVKDKRIDELETASAKKDKEIEKLQNQVEMLQEKVNKLEGNKTRPR